MCALRYALCAAIFAVPSAQATSIVIKLSDQRILIAADTMGIDSAGIAYQDQCKILLSGKAAFCGGLRGDWDEHYFQPVSAAIQHIARDHDEYYPSNTP